MVEASDKEGDEFEIEYKWIVNGAEMAEPTGNIFSTKELKVGDEIYLEARAKEKKTGNTGKWKRSDKITIGNPPAEELAGVDIQPQPLYQFTPARAVVDYGKANPEEIKIYYRWTVNGKILEADDAQGPELPTKYFKRNDKVNVTVSTDERFSFSKVKTSPIYTVANAPPEFGSPQVNIDGNLAYIYLNATDPEGDPIEYSVVEGPRGTVLEDSATGRFRVDMRQLDPGTYSVVFQAKDKFGGVTEYSTNITVPETAKPESSPFVPEREEARPWEAPTEETWSPETEREEKE